MPATDTVQRVRIYLSDADALSGEPLYLAAMNMLREAGATGATALRGVAGFGASQRLHSAETSGGRGMPIVIEWVDRIERVSRVLPVLDALLPHALITIEAVQVYRAALRSSGPFGEHALADLAVRDVATTTAQRSVADALRLLGAGQLLLPVLDDGGHLVGVVGEPALQRLGLPPLAQLAALDERERAALLAGPGARPLAEVMATDMLALSADASVLQAANAMAEWGLEQVPIIGRDGRFYGLFGVTEALQAALATSAPPEGPISNADTPAPISVLMQGTVQTVLGYAPAAEGLERLAALHNQPLIVVDNGRPLGVLDPHVLIRDAKAELRPALALLLGDKRVAGDAVSALGDMRVASLPLKLLPELSASATYDAAIRMLLDHDAQWLGAVDEQGKLQGLVGRRTLLRALVQASFA